MKLIKKWCLAFLAPALLTVGCAEGPEVSRPETAPAELTEGAAALASATFSGTVRDPNGQPIAGAKVTINGLARTTNTSGQYFVSVGVSTSGYILNASKAGFGPMTEYLSGSTLGNFTTLPRATVRQFSGGQPITFETADVTVTIPAGSLVNAAGQPVTGPVSISVAAYAPRSMPGDFTGVNSQGRTVALESVGAFFIGATDSLGAAVNLGERRTAQVTLRVPAQVGRIPACVKERTCRVAAWRFNTSLNRWVEQQANLITGTVTSTFTLIGGPASTNGFPLETNGGLGTWNIDLENANPACTIVQFVGFDSACYPITLNLAMQNSNNTWIPNSDTVTDSIPFVVLYNNRPNVDQEVGIVFPATAPPSCWDPNSFSISSSPGPTDPSSYPQYPPTTPYGGFTQFNAGPPWGGTGFPEDPTSPNFPTGGTDIDFADVTNGDHPCGSTVTFTWTP